MIDYYEIKSQPITRVMVLQAYRKVKANNGSAGIDGMNWEDLDKDLSRQLYKLWNRLTSGSYLPRAVKEVTIKKKSGGDRNLGIPTILDRIAQEVVKSHLERILEPLFHDSSYGYRPNRNCHQALEKLQHNALWLDWAIDLDIKSFFDTIDHELLMKSLRHYCKDEWVLLYVKRWLEAGIIQKDGIYIDRLSGTPQGGVISPLLANLFLHVTFDKWMKLNHPEILFERYADDIVIHCKTERYAHFMLKEIVQRLSECNLAVHPEKTKIVRLRGVSENRYPRSLDFLGFTLKPKWWKTNKGLCLLPLIFTSKNSTTAVLKKIKYKKIHTWRKSIEDIAFALNPILRGVINYYCKFRSCKCQSIWKQVNHYLLKWVRWEKGFSKMKSVNWLRMKCKENPRLFVHWRLVNP